MHTRSRSQSDVELAGFVVTAEEWDALETTVRCQLLAAAIDTISVGVCADGVAFIHAAAIDRALLAPVHASRAARAPSVADYDVYELTESAA